MSNIRVIKSTPTDQDELRVSIDGYKKSVPNLVEFNGLKAAVKHAYFQSLQAAGFTRDEAFGIILAEQD